MISAADYTVLNSLFTKPHIKGNNLLRVHSGIHKVSRVHKEVSVGENWNRVVTTMGIGGNHQSHWLSHFY
jgi:hypothetical protein